MQLSLQPKDANWAEGRVETWEQDEAGNTRISCQGPLTS